MSADQLHQPGDTLSALSSESVHMIGSGLNDEAETITISRMILLDEVLKHLGGRILTHDCDWSPNGYFTSIKAQVPKRRGSTEKIEMVGYSYDYFHTESEATDKAADDLIGSLKREFKFEVDDVNWKTRKECERNNTCLYDRVGRLKEEVASLNSFVDSLVSGWTYSLELAESVSSMCGALCLSVYSGFGLVEFGGNGEQAMSNTVKLKNMAMFTLLEGRNAMSRVLNVNARE